MVSLLNKSYLVIGTLDFRNNKSELLISYLLRLLGVVFFGYIFYLVANFLNNDTPFRELVSIEILGVAPIFSIFLCVVDVAFVLFLHELIHALVYYVTNKQNPRFGMRGWVIYAAAPNQLITKRNIIINALAPFVVISFLGLSLLTLVPVQFASWIFLPTLVNAAAAGGDFMVVYFALKHSKEIQYNDKGDIIYALRLNTTKN